MPLILWGKKEGKGVGEYAEVAADALQLTAGALKKLGIVDEIVPEPSGGAHRDYDLAAENLGRSIALHLSELCTKSGEELVESRYEKLKKISP